MKRATHATWVDILRRLAPLLPIDLFDRLRASSYPATPPAEVDCALGDDRALGDDLRQAIRTLGSLRHTLTNFLPRYLLDLSPQPGEPHGELLQGSFIFADVTGFTALTGELSKHGAEGREEMNRLMSDLFAALLDPLMTSGGDLLMFAGDAALAHLPAHPDGQDACWATRTALRLVESIASFSNLTTPYGDFSLTMSAGVERGHAFAAVVGARKRMELLISGGPVQGAMRAEGQAEPGQVFAGPAIRPFLSPNEFILHGGVVQGVQDGKLDDYEIIPPTRRRTRASVIASRRVPDLIEHLQATLQQVEQLVPFISHDLFSQLARGENISQHPPVAIQFVNLVGLEEIALGPSGPERAAAILHRYFCQAQEIITDREGIVNKLDPYAHGCFLLNPFGAPTHHERVPSLAASAALELTRALERINQEFRLDPPLTQRTGLTYDHIFTGELGYRHRREYVVAGPAVNLAARLMSKADPGQVILDPIAWQAIRRDFYAAPLPPVPLKGISEPVPRFALQKLRRARGIHLADYPLVDRQKELAQLEKKLNQATTGRGSAFALVGKAGAGKSRLITALAHSAQQRGVATLTARCRPFGKTTPYFPWQDLLCQWFEIDLDQDTPETCRQQLTKRLDQFDLTLSLPAFADLLGLPAIDVAFRITQAQTHPPGANLFAALQEKTTPQTGQADWTMLAERTATAQTAQAKEIRPSLWETLRQRASIPQALHTLIERQARRQPTLLIIEDIQWMDAESRETLCEVATTAPGWPLFLLTTTRPETGWWVGDQLPLSPLSDENSRKLAALALRATRLQPELARWLLARTGGNPLFILSYCRAMRDAGSVVIDPASGEARWNGPPPPLPLSLQDILLAQVDRLEKKTRQAMQRGAVIGVTFPSWLLAQLAQDTLTAAQLDKAMDQAARRALIAPPPPTHTHTFSSQSLQDAIYTTLSHTLRRDWHEQVGDQLAAAETTRYEQLEQIAHHYSRSGHPRKAARFTRLAGDKARARQTDQAALSFYAQTLAVTGGPEIDVEQSCAHEGIGDVHALQGADKAARAAYATALQESPPERANRLRAKLALLAPLDGATDPEALNGARQTLHLADPLRPWLRAASAWLHARRGETETAASTYQSLLSTAGEPLGTLLQQMLDSLEHKDPRPAYSDFFSLFAHSCLRPSPSGELFVQTIEKNSERTHK